MKRKKKNIFDVGENEIKRKKENVTFYSGEKLKVKFDEIINDNRYDSRSKILRRFMEHYSRNPAVFEQLFWELEKLESED